MQVILKTMKAKSWISQYGQKALLAVLAIAVFCYWYFLYPYVIVAREMSQLFLWNSDYFMERIIIPGGFAQYLSEFLVQYFLNPINGAFTYALLFILEQQLASRWLQQFFPTLKERYRLVLSLVLPLVLWRVAMIPHIPVTPTIAVILVMGVGCVMMELRKNIRLVSVCILIPIIYWLTGPATVLLLLCCLRWIPLTAALLASSIIGSSYLAPYPLRQVIKGVDYDWSGVKKMGSYEEMECDMLLRMNKWEKILQKYHNPMSPAVQSAILLASYQTGQIDKQELMHRIIGPADMPGREPTIFNYNGLHLMISFGNLSSAFMVSDIASLLNMYNISQRAAFEAMEYIPNHNKSGRALKRLVETSIITGQYDVAKKYLSILDETFFYKNWAEKTRPLVEHPEQIMEYPFYQKSKEFYENSEDYFFI